MAEHGVVVKVWGARGSVACPGPRTVRYGGNTSCVEVRCSAHRVVFDGGTGIRELGVTMWGEPPSATDVFLTHFHMDHISGLPFFAAAYVPENEIVFRAARLEQPVGLREILHKMMSPPLFPIPIDAFRACVRFEDFACGATMEPRPEVTIETRALNHPGGACGYRLTYGGVSIAYVTDTEHVPGQDDENVIALMRGADLAFYDATYCDSEFASHVGWGHSTWQEAIRIADLAEVRTLALFHHDPRHLDPDLDRIASEAAAARPGTIVAQEGMTFEF